MGLKEKFKQFIDKSLYYPKWTCNVCGEEIFSDDYFCPNCKSQLSFISGPICDHCGRITLVPENYCHTCKGRLVSTEKARSVFDYKPPISSLIKGFKYDNKRYLLEFFAKELSFLYFKYFYDCEVITFVPMTLKSEKEREYNQSRLLAERLSEIVKTPCLALFEKVKETQRQATLNREDRLKNLKGAFRLISRKQVKEKRILIVDDVSTTGTTAEILAQILNKAKAKSVCLLTLASVSTLNLENL